MQVCHETQHLGSMFVQTAQQIEGQGLLDPAAALIPAQCPPFPTLPPELMQPPPTLYLLPSVKN